ncbi:MAG: phosphoserine phosphatase SerB [Pseudomonadota bacterium]|nr:phosphoserine phosphatase SerB [Pseudomonadota bacterium]
MPLVATLIAEPASRALERGLAQHAAATVGAMPPSWLCEGVACDIALPAGMEAAKAYAILAAALAGLPVDLAVQEAARRRKKGLIADMDSTMIGQECIDELAEEAGLRERVSAITARAMNGEIAFEPALRERVALLKGLSATIVDRVLAERITLAPGGAELVATMRANGGHTMLVSGGFTAFAGPIAAQLGFDEFSANTLNQQAGRFDGTVAEPILGRQAKVDALRRGARAHGLDTTDFIAVGDGANDLDMLAMAGTGVALHAKPSVAEKADIRIDHGDLTALLYLQGYSTAEFVT